MGERETEEKSWGKHRQVANKDGGETAGSRWMQAMTKRKIMAETKLATKIFKKNKYGGRLRPHVKNVRQKSELGYIFHMWP